MAFDLLKLQILQEALDKLKQPFVITGMCTVIYTSIDSICKLNDSTLLDNDYETFIMPSVFDIIHYSIELRNECDKIVSAYIWPLTRYQKLQRIKYLERLIEDEMSGTYFMDMNHGI
jgi:hypothetical protein